VHLLGKLSSVYLSQGNWQEAERCLEQAFALEMQVAPEQIAPIYSNMGAVKEHLGLYEAANAFYQRGLSRAETAGHREYTCMLLINLGHAAEAQGRRREAQAYFSRALKIALQLGHKPAICVLLSNLGSTEFDPDQACTFFREGIEVAAEINHQEYLLACRHGLAERLAMQGHYDEAEALIASGLEVAGAVRHRTICQLYYLQGRIALQRGRYAEAEAALERALHEAREVDDNLSMARIQLAFSQLALERKAVEQAATHLQTSTDLIASLANQALQVAYHYQYGEFQLFLRNPEQAQRHFEQALRIGQEIESLEANGLTLYGLARCFHLLQRHEAARHHAEQSIELLTLVKHQKRAVVEDFLQRTVGVAKMLTAPLAVGTRDQAGS
jgi:tetratricopeptide (TPR) repeat protein